MTRYKSPAIRRYVIRLAVLMAIYLVTLFIAVRTFRSGPVPDIIAWPLAIAPALPVVGIFWAFARLLIEEKDEFQRLLLVGQSLVATAFTLSIATVWGFLENFRLVPHVDAFYIAILWFVGLGVGSIYNRVSLGAGDCADRA